MFRHLGRITATYPKSICTFWITVGLCLSAIAPHWDTQTQDDDIRFVPDRFTSVRAYQLLEKGFPKDVSASNLVFALERDEGPLTQADMRLVDALVRDLNQLGLGKVTSYADGFLGYQLTSGDRQCTLIQVSLGTPFLALATKAAVDRAGATVQARLGQADRGGLHVFTTGAAGVGRDLTKVCGESLEDTTLATVILVVVVLLCVYRAPLLALVPLVTIAVSVWVSLKLLALMTLLPGVHLVNISKIFAIVILYGAGTDYCLFLISRYREELQAGFAIPQALARGLGGVGEALAASAGTVMVGLGLMATAEFAKVRYAGPAIALSLGVALVAALTLTPALLRLLGRAVFWPGRPPGVQASEAPGQKSDFRLLTLDCRPPTSDSRRPGLWDCVSNRVAAHPVLVWTAAALVLLPLVVVGLHVQSTYRATGELCPETESLRGLAAIQRHFTAGEIGPVTVLLASDTDWSSREGILEIDHLSRGFAQLPNVAQVRSLTQPLGRAFLDLAPVPGSDGWVTRVLTFLEPIMQSFREEMQDMARDHYVARIQDDAPAPKQRFITRLDIILKSDPFEQESIATLKLIQTWLDDVLPHHSLVGNVRTEVFGITANGKDLAEVTEGDRHRVNALVLLAIFAILLILVRKPVLAAYLLTTVLASYFAALGATVLAESALAGTLWTGQPLASVDWRVPFFLFTILVAVGEDYNILLVCRALQERRRFGPVEGMRRALAKTGGAITSCGLIMAGTFATLMLAGLGTLMQIGFALAFGVLIDTFLVRPFLVPAFAMIFWRDGQPIPSQASEVARKENAEETDGILDARKKAA
jgi:RND superfamily putative drug exporter